MITDASIISISTHCTQLQLLNLENCYLITDVCIISISNYCTGLQSLSLWNCNRITDASIISISENCTALNRLLVSHTNITDASLIAIAKNCIGLKSLSIDRCMGLSNDVMLDHCFESIFDLRAALLSIYPSLPISS